MENKIKYVTGNVYNMLADKILNKVSLPCHGG